MKEGVPNKKSSFFEILQIFPILYLQNIATIKHLILIFFEISIFTSIHRVKNFEIFGIKSLSFDKTSIHKQDLRGKSANFNKNVFSLFATLYFTNSILRNHIANYCPKVRSHQKSCDICEKLIATNMLASHKAFRSAHL